MTETALDARRFSQAFAQAMSNVNTGPTALLTEAQVAGESVYRADSPLNRAAWAMLQAYPARSEQQAHHVLWRFLAVFDVLARCRDVLDRYGYVHPLLLEVAATCPLALTPRVAFTDEFWDRLRQARHDES
ncbi:MAG: hypothetical protein KKA73_01670 [Chloroflexi bacterium]|nr:hypothetical protein [Chloroflexota bacterium]MBU1746373.1 hypothetical protein [Chloroflexota bacterium]